MKNTKNVAKLSVQNLIKFLLLSMLFFEDATQMAEDCTISNYLDGEVTRLDTHYHRIKNSQAVSPEELNSIRMIVKYSYKMIPEKIATELELKYKNILFN